MDRAPAVLIDSAVSNLHLRNTPTTRQRQHCRCGHNVHKRAGTSTGNKDQGVIWSDTKGWYCCSRSSRELSAAGQEGGEYCSRGRRQEASTRQIFSASNQRNQSRCRSKHRAAIVPPVLTHRASVAAVAGASRPRRRCCRERRRVDVLHVRRRRRNEAGGRLHLPRPSLLFAQWTMPTP